MLMLLRFFIRLLFQTRNIDGGLPPATTSAVVSTSSRAHINFTSSGFWGLVSTIILTGLMAGAQGLGLTRMSLPFMLGTMFTPDRDRAKLVGFLFHLLIGWWLALIYAAAFQSWRRATWWLGAGIGLIHGFFVLLTIVRLLPALHPRMASEQRGPTPTKQLEPPGFLALNYGRRTPLTVLLAHVAYGATLGAFYKIRR